MAGVDDITVSHFQVAESNRTELVDKSFVVSDLTARVRVNLVSFGVEPELADLPVWVARDQERGPVVWHGRADDGSPIVMINAHHLDSDRGIAKIIYALSSEEFSMSAEAAKHVVARTCEAAGVWEAEQEIASQKLLDAAKTVRDTRESAKQKHLAAARQAAQLAAPPTTTEGPAEIAQTGQAAPAPAPDTSA